MRKPRVLVAEDHELVAQGLVAMLAGQFDIVASIADGAAVVDAVAHHKPDVLLLDLSLPNRGGIDMLPDLVRASPETHVLVLSMHIEPHLVDAAMSSGAAGFVPKNASVEELATAIREVLAGRRYVSPKLPKRSRGVNLVSNPDPIGFSRLSLHQQDIVRRIARGLTSDEIAKEMGLSVWTIQFHRKRIRRILGIHSELEMHRYALLVSAAEVEQGEHEVR